jgi:hypothetical protein
LVKKAERLSTRLSNLEARLSDPNLKSERERVIYWKIEKLKDALQQTREAIEAGSAYSSDSSNSDSDINPHQAQSDLAPIPVPAGRRCGNSKGGRPDARTAANRVSRNKRSEFQGSVETNSFHALAVQEPEKEGGFDFEDGTPDFRTASKIPDESWQSVITEIKCCREDLKAAHKLGKQEAIQHCELALQEALEKKKERVVARRVKRQNWRQIKKK